MKYCAAVIIGLIKGNELILMMDEVLKVYTGELVAQLKWKRRRFSYGKSEDTCLIPAEILFFGLLWMTK